VGRNLTRWLIPLPAILFAVFPQTANAEPTPGLATTYYTINQIPPVQSTTEYPVCGTETENNINRSYDGEPYEDCTGDLFMVHMTGYITIPVHNTIEFWLASDDGGEITIDGNTFGVWWDQGCSATESGPLQLDAESVPLELFMYENGGGTCIMLAWNINGQGWEMVPDSAFTTTGSPTTTTSSSTTLFVSSTTTLLDQPTTTTQAPQESSTTTTLPPTSTTTTSSSTTTLPTKTSTTTTQVQSTTTTQTTSTTTTTTIPIQTTTITAPYTLPQTTTSAPVVATAPDTTTTTSLPEPETTTTTTILETSTTDPSVPLPNTTDLSSSVPTPIPTSETSTPTSPQPQTPDTQQKPTTTETISSPTTLLDIEAKQPITDEKVAEVLDGLKDASPAQVVAAIEQILTTAITSDQAVSIASSPEVLAAITQDQAEQIFQEIVVDELTLEVAEELVAVLNEAPTKVKKAFQDTINVFAGVFDSFQMVGQTIPVGQRRTLVAVSNTLVAVGASLRRREK
jgi:hypothetical protein